MQGDCTSQYHEIFKLLVYYHIIGNPLCIIYVPAKPGGSVLPRLIKGMMILLNQLFH